MRDDDHLLYGAVVLGSLIGSSLGAQQLDSLSGVQMVEVDGHAVRVQALGLQDRSVGSPVVVFESGVTNQLEVWARVLPRVARSAPVVAYDRAGVGRSEWDSVTPTPQHVSDRLRRLLHWIGAEPPYVLVGYSWGGILARYFAGFYPDDIAGLVLVDPAPIITLTSAEQLASFEAIGAGRAGYDAYWSAFATLYERMPPAVRAEFNVFRDLMQADGAERDLRTVPDVPLVIVVAGKYLALPAMRLPYDPRVHFEADLRHRIAALQEWALGSSRGTLTVSNHSTHAVPREDPDLIVWAIQRVLATVGGRP